MKCHSCDNEVPQDTRACDTCIQQATDECIKCNRECMEMLDRHLILCDDEKSYKANRDSYHRYRLENLYLAGAIPRPATKKCWKTLGQRGF